MEPLSSKKLRGGTEKAANTIIAIVYRETFIDEIKFSSSVYSVTVTMHFGARFTDDRKIFIV